MTNKMWGGRFRSGPDAIMEEINASIGFDQRLFAQDIAGSKAHAAMLAAQGIITQDRRRRDPQGPRCQSQARSRTVRSPSRAPWRTFT